MNAPIARAARLTLADLIRLGLVGPRTRRLRSALSALGIALGIAALVAVTGISASHQAHLLDRLNRLGSNLITVSPGVDVNQQPVPLPKESVAMLGAVAPVETVSATGATKADIYRNDHVPVTQTNGLSVLSARVGLLETLHGKVRVGRWLDGSTEKLPVVVLGSEAADRLGAAAPGERVWLCGKEIQCSWFSVLGILSPNLLAPEIDSAALTGRPWSAAHLGDDGTPATVYVRTHPARVTDVQAVAGATANPAAPNLVSVSRPSDLLKARAETKTALEGMVLALAGVALVVGGLGIANTMVVGVMERRGEVGLRRALGARPGQIAAQFLVEAVMLGLFGGSTGILLGGAAVHVYAGVKGWPTSTPLTWVIAGPAVAVVIAAVAGLYPAMRAARMSPTEALRSA
ncbi:ABC transporter permease [Streptomyces sp. NPDC049687]|uniref:ABC transporter permease n=1 Tax=Streptomyces sp. NPDC049687 TaxID=3365596 RepID=UPI00379E6561